MKNREISDIFERMADLLELLEANRFRINSYRKSARVIGDLTDPVEDIADQGRLAEIPGIGKGTAEKILEYLQAGKIEQYEQLTGQIPPDLPQLLEVGGLGPKTVAKLWKDANIVSIVELKQAIESDPDRLIKIDGLGAKKVQKIAESLAFAEAASKRMRLDEARSVADMLIDTIRTCPGAKRTMAAGSLRRGEETIGDVDILCEASESKAENIIEAFTNAPGAQRVLAKGKTKGSIVLEGEIQADLRVIPAVSFGATMAYFTGSKEHNVRMRELAIRNGWKLSEYGLFDGDRQIAGRDEEGLYKAMGMAFVPPELREDRGELQAASEGQLPELVELRDIRGDLHVHTVASDGHNTIEEMIAASLARGYKYVAICDHSKSQVQANGLDADRLAEHAGAIRQAGQKYKNITVLAGCEVDIFKDGSLDFGADVLAELDFVTASAHSALSLGRDEATRRIITAIETPHVHCIGHPSGRLINKRAGMEIDITEIAHAAAANDVALEINAHPWRLDLRDVHVRAAIEAGAKIIINTDAHEIDGLDMIVYGVTTARRGWATASDVINPYSATKLKNWLKRKA